MNEREQAEGSRSTGQWSKWMVLLAIILGAGVAFMAASRLSGEIDFTVEPRLLAGENLAQTGAGMVKYRGPRGQEMRVFTYRATRFDPAAGPIWFVMHGTNRNAEDYRDLSAAAAERVNALLVVTEFARWAYPKGSDYTLGVTRSGKPDADALSEKRWAAPDQYVYSEIERLFDLIVDEIGGQQRGYYLFGHSAGAQFVHRLLTFLPEHRVVAAVAANAGWYTLPRRDAEVQSLMPYGLRATPVTEEMQRNLFASNLTVLLGEQDVLTSDEDSNVRGTREALAQGKNRLQRGRYYFQTGQEEARRLGASFQWKLAVVKHAHHKAGEMLPSAMPYLFGSGVRPCEPDEALEGIEIVEVLPDPPDGESGDLNRDGRRVGIEDEYVVVKNTTHREACLSGWTLGDRQSQTRHVFPLGTELRGGESIIVFGGGIPTGDFTSQVNWASSGRLSLSNTGDEIELRDRTGKVVSSRTW